MLRRVLLVAVLGCSCAFAQAPQLLHTLDRFGTRSGGSYFPCTWTASWGGYAHRAGDVDGDGYDDILVEHTLFATYSGYCGAVGFEDRRDSTVVSGRTQLPLHQFARSLVVSVGDVDGDGCADLGVRGQPTQIISGATGGVLYTLPDSIGLSEAGDLDRDGFGDVHHVSFGHPRTITIYSGADSSIMRTHPGFAARRCGDLDGDGHPESIISSLSFSVSVMSGRTGAALLTIPPPSVGTGFGSHVACAGDTNGDGIDDIIIDGAFDGAVYSGADGSVLLSGLGTTSEPAGDMNSDGFDDIVDAGIIRSGFDGSALASGLSPPYSVVQGAGIGDFNRDGHPDVVFGTRSSTWGAGAAVVTLQSTPGAPLEWFRGMGCIGSGQSLPHIGFEGEARQGTTLTATLGGSRPLAPTVLHLGLESDVPLDLIGAAGCSLYSVPFVVFPSTTGASGRASVLLTLSASALPLGARVDLQWVTLDLGGNALVLRVGQ